MLPAARAGAVLAHTLPAPQTGRPTAVLAGMKIACVATLWALTAASAVREQRGRNGHADRCHEDERSADASVVHRVGLLWMG